MPRTKIRNTGHSNVEGRLRRRTNSGRVGVSQTAPPPLVVERPIGRYVRNQVQEDAYRAGDYTHASDLIYKCMRMVALADSINIPVPPQQNWSSMSVIHAMGHSVADWITQKVLSQTGSVYGMWACACEATQVGPCKPEEAYEIYCETCNQGCTNYKEMHFKNDDVMVVGHCDLAFMEHDQLIVTELKSISKNQFDDLRAPKPDHLMQILLYAWLARAAGYNVARYASVFYVRREWAPADPFQEFTVDIDEQIHRVEPLIEEARRIKEWKLEQQRLPHQICTAATDARAKQCPMVGECFLRSGD